MKKQKTARGITLIALIITIVVLLILAVVAINAVNDTGIIRHAENAASGYDTKKAEEEGILIGYEEVLDQYGGNGGSGEETVTPTDASYFTLIEETSGYTVTGLTEEGKQLTDIIIPSEYNGKTINVIGSCAFKDCPNLKTITIPGSVLNILDYMVYGNCPNLTDVYCKFPEGRASKFISNWKAGIADKLHFEEAQIPETQKYFAYTLDTTTNTATITGLNKDYANIIQDGSAYYYTAIKDENNNYITAIEIPNKIVGDDDGIDYVVTAIGAEAFNGGGESAEKSFTSIVIPNTVTTIGARAFLNCAKLTSVVIPDSVTTIGFYAFTNCIRLATVNIPSNVISIEGYAFANCTSLTTVNIPSQVTSMGQMVFEACNSLTTINVDKTQSECSGWPSGWNGNANVKYKQDSNYY